MSPRRTLGRLGDLNGRARLPAGLGAEGVTASLVLAIVLAGVTVGPEVWPRDPNATDLPGRFAAPSLDAPLGTDDFGRDVLARLMIGGRRSLMGAAIVVTGATFAGMVIGVASAVAGRRMQSLLGRLTDAFLAMPSLVIAMAIVGFLGTGFANLVLALVLVSWPWYARLYRSFALQQLTGEYVLAAESLGCSRLRIAWRHIGPNILGPALVLSTTSLGAAILGLASLSFLGLGLAPPDAEWGAMVDAGRSRFQTHPWLILAPGLAISITVIAINVLGDLLRDLADPH
ncbi:MAG: ABC transporter permease [Dehalococcoidia bacterium]